MYTDSAIRAVVFDFDGVIADSEGAHEAALLETAGRLGMSFTPEQYRTELIGFDDRDAYPAIARLNGREIAEPDAADLAETKRVLVEEMIARGEIKPLPGAVDLVRSAADRVPIAICSGALGSEIRLMLASFGVSNLFQTIVAADDVPHAKPDPAGYAMAAARLGLTPKQCAAIEDTSTGIAAARAAGYGRVVGVCHSVDRAQLYQADQVAASTVEVTIEDLLGIASE